MTPCTHPLVVDEPSDEGWRRAALPLDRCNSIRRRCLLCGFYYHRTGVLERLADSIRARSRLPRSPWSAAERSEDTE